MYPRSFVIFFAIVATLTVGPISDAKSSRYQIQSNVPGSFCQGCRSIVSFFGRFNSTTSRAENMDLFEKFCTNYYPVSTDYRLGPCQAFAEGLFFIIDRIDPMYHCDRIGACGTGNPPQTNALVAESDHEGPFCQVCDQIVKQFQERIEDPKVIDEIHKQVSQLCDYLIVIDADKQCRAAFLSYIDQALEYIKIVKPKDLCSAISLCSPAPPQPNMSMAQDTSNRILPQLADFSDFGIETTVQVDGQTITSLKEKNIKKGPNCMFCKSFVKEMFKFIRQNRTEENIRQALDQVCQLIYRNPDKREHCEDLVSAYSKELVELLVDETDPEVICMLLEQCTYHRAPTTTNPPEQDYRQSSLDLKNPVTFSQLASLLDPSIRVGSMRTCVECKLFIRYLQDNVRDPKSQEEIKDWVLSNICSKISDPSVSDSCVKFVNQESETFFKALVEELNPEVSCKQMGACHPRVRKEYLTQLRDELAKDRDLEPIDVAFNYRDKTPQVETGYYCNQCVDVVTKVDDYLSTHPIDHDISVLKDKVCNSIEDNSLRGECVLIIQTFGQEIIQAISTSETPRELCEKIKLCSTSI